MTNGNDLGGGHAARELDLRSGGYVSDTPGVDGSVLGAGDDLARDDTGAAGLTMWRPRGNIVAAAIGSGLLALGLTLLGGRLFRRRSRTFAGFMFRSRPKRRSLFAR